MCLPPGADETISDSQHGFTEGKSCPIKLVATCARVTALVGEGRGTDVIHLDLCQASDAVPQDNPVSKLETHGPHRWTTRGDKELAGWSHSI